MERLRGVSAVAVVVNHVEQNRSQIAKTNRALGPLLTFGTPAMTGFFLLSGFVIGHTVVEPFSLGQARAYLFVIVAAATAFILEKTVQPHLNRYPVVVAHCLVVPGILTLRSTR